jgi:signal transduction histidine kinase
LNGQHDDPAQELPELRARIEQLEEELRARDEFIMAAAHELRNPISPLTLHVGRLAVAARTAAGGTVQAAWLTDQLDALGRRLTRFVSALNRILDLSSINSGRIQLLEEQVDLSAVVAEVVAGFGRELVASQSELALELSGPVCGTWDRLRLEQIVSNLVSNAIRYGDGQPIAVSLRTRERVAELVVSDLGLGIAERDQTRIFERFSRVQGQSRSGFGVGLWLVRQLCAAMGGSVDVESVAGEGATFRVVLPTNRDGSGDDR